MINTKKFIVGFIKGKINYFFRSSHKLSATIPVAFLFVLIRIKVVL